MAPLINLLIASLSDKPQHMIMSQATSVDLPLRTLMEAETERPEYVYFLNRGIASMVVALSEGGTAEVALIGCEGLTGAYSLLGPAFPAMRTFMQVPGSGSRVPFSVMRALFSSSEEIRNAILRFVQQQSVTTGQLVGCAQLHGLEERLARWLLMVQDRVGGDDIWVTHEFLAQMLAVHRPSVTVALGMLARAGLIQINRSCPKIVNRDGLVKAACACYPITRRLLKGLYPLKGVAGMSLHNDRNAGETSDPLNDGIAALADGRE